MSFAVLQRSATVLTAVVAFTAVAVGGYLDPVFIVAWYLGSAAAAALPDGRFRSGWVTAIALFSFPVVLVLAVRGTDVVAAAAYYAAVLLLARLVFRQDSESHAQSHLLSVLVLASGSALSPDITYLLCFVVFVFALTWALLLNQLRRERGVEALALPSREVVGNGLTAAVFGLTTLALLATATVFIIFPRTTLSLGFRRPVGGNESGLSDRVRLAGFGRIKENDRVVMRVEAGDEDASAWLETAYWRAHVLDRFEGLDWTGTEPEAGSEESRSVWRGRSETGVLDRESVEVEVVADLGTPVIPHLDRMLFLRLQGRDARGDYARLRQIRFGELRTQGNPLEPWRYQVFLERNRRVVLADPPTTEDLVVGDLDPRIVELSRTLAGEGSSDRQIAERVERWLSSELGYTLDLPGEDPSLDAFLFERREGHCEYFAAAMVVLLRQAGVSARMVTGFYGGAWSEAGGYHVVRQGDAHAWVEAWEEGAGWVRYDPTPVEGRGSARTGDLGQQLSDLWDAIQQRWSNLVLDYDLRSQVSIARRIGRAFRELGEAFGGRRARGAGRLMPMLVTVLLLVGAVFAWRRLKLGRYLLGRRPSALSPDAQRARALWRSLLRVLVAAGVERREADTAEDVVRRLGEAPGAEEAVVRRVQRLAERYEASRFGGRALPADEARALGEEVDRIRARLRSRKLEKAA